MSYAKSLRVIGQVLEASRITAFKIEHHGEAYRIWIGKSWFRLGAADIGRFDALAQKRRRNSGMATRPPKSLSQQLRALGALLDRIDIRSFRIVWQAGCATLEYEKANRERKRRVFSAEELFEMSQQGRLLRTNRYLFPRLDI